jgi:hypothetical protein
MSSPTHGLPATFPLNALAGRGGEHVWQLPAKLGQ